MHPSFAEQTKRLVPAEGRHRGSPAIRWVVEIRRGGAWPSWQLFDRLLNYRLSNANSEGSPAMVQVWPSLVALVAVRLFVWGLAGPTIAYRAVRYRLARRTDWDVVVFCGEDEKRNRTLVENFQTKEAAAARAEELWAYLDQRDELPAPSKS